jgi:hypothetical protein
MRLLQTQRPSLSPLDESRMSLRSVVFTAGMILAGALVVLGAVGAIEFLVHDKCDTSGYLCEPLTANISDKAN